MPRIAGVDIPEKKKVLYSLQYIHGIGPKVAASILAKTGIDGERRTHTLTPDELTSISKEIDERYVVEGALHRGERHRKGLPARGQRTRTNARTRKGRKKTVAGKKGVKG
jgi:small subunit ribosomal protein S13